MPVSDWIAAGKAGAQSVSDLFQVARANSPDYGKLAEVNMVARSRERQAAIAAEARVRQAGLSALATTKSAKIAADASDEIYKDKAGAARMAGYVGALGAVAGGAALYVDNKREDERIAQRDAEREQNQEQFLTEMEEMLSSAPTPKPELQPIPQITPITPLSPAASTTSTSESTNMEFVPAQPVASYTQSSEGTPFTPETTYAYLTDVRKLSRNQALGIMANIQRESSFRTNPAGGDQGNSFGALQWNNTYGRSDIMKASVPNWQTNWKGQLDHMLSQNQLPEYNSFTKDYLNTNYETPEAASEHLLRMWFRPLDTHRDIQKNNQFLQGFTNL